MRYYDEVHKRLVYVSAGADSDFWDAHWDEQKAINSYREKIPSYNMVLSNTKKFLPKGAHVLEGGAGLATNSWYLHLAGYKVTALDYAPKTVAFLKKNRPEVNPVLGDVHALKQPSGSFDGYWSLGVIEHFYDGYDKIVHEAHRVISNGGYFFLTFPYMSKFRRLKAKLGKYPKFTGEAADIEKFYQFALNKDSVIDVVRKAGFELSYEKSMGGLKGFKDEVKPLKSILQYIYDGQNIFLRIIRRVLEISLGRLFGHDILLVFKKVQ